MNKSSATHLRLPLKSLLAFLIILILLEIVVGYRAYTNISRSYEGSQDLNVVGSLRMLIQRINSSTITLTSGLSTQDTYQNLQRDIARADLIISGLREGHAALQIRPITDLRELQLLENLENNWTRYLQTVDHIITEGSQMPLEERRQLVGQLNNQANEITRFIDELIVLEQERTKQSLQVLALNFLTGGMLGTIIILFFWYLFLQRGFIKPLTDLLPAVEAILQCDATQRVPEEGSSSTINIAANYNRMANNMQTTYTKISQNLYDILTLNNRLMWLGRELYNESSKSYADGKTDLELIKDHLQSKYPELLETIEQLSVTNEKHQITHQNIDSLTHSIIDVLAKQSYYAEDLRDKQVFLEPSLENNNLIDLLIADLEMRRQRVHLYVMGYGEPNSIGTCRLDKWQKDKGRERFHDHPRFESLIEHHENFHKALDEVLDSIANNQVKFLQETLGRVDTFTELAIIDLQHLKAACQ